LGRLAEKLAAVRAGGAQRRVVRSQRLRTTRRPGWVVDALVQVLDSRGEPMRAREIHTAVETMLGEAVTWSSVKGALASNVSGSPPRFVRVARGRYVLAGR
jgi:HB1, ASXL, restriction endonuclease HTH domain